MTKEQDEAAARKANESIENWQYSDEDSDGNLVPCGEPYYDGFLAGIEHERNRIWNEIVKAHAPHSYDTVPITDDYIELPGSLVKEIVFNDDDKVRKANDLA